MDARFALDRPRLAFTVDESAGECDYPAVYARPDPVMLAVLRATDDVLTLRDDGLPERVRR